MEVVQQSPESDNHVRIQRGGGTGPPAPLKNHESIGFSSNTGPDPLKNHCYQDSIQCWAIIGIDRFESFPVMILYIGKEASMRAEQFCASTTTEFRVKILAG